MSKGKKKKKQKPQKPKLSFLNKVLYWTLLFLGMILVFSSFIVFTVCQQRLGAQNNAIAVKETASVLLILIPLLPAIIVGGIFFEMGYMGRVPLIPTGEKPLAWKKKKRSPVMKWIIVLAVLLWLTTFVPVIGAVFNRVEINSTHIDTYAMFGRLTEHRPVADATEVSARIYFQSGRGAHGWRMSYTIRFADGESFTFQNLPTVMLEIDSLFPGVPKSVEGTKNFEKLCNEYNCTEEVRQQLKVLFLING